MDETVTVLMPYKRTTTWQEREKYETNELQGKKIDWSSHEDFGIILHTDGKEYFKSVYKVIK